MTETGPASTRLPMVMTGAALFPRDEIVSGWRQWAVLAALFLVSLISQIDRILPFILAEAIRSDLDLSDTQIGLITGVAFAICYSLLSLPLARAADRGSPRLVLVACVLGWSVMTALGGLAAGFLFLAFTRLGVAFGEAGAVPSGHAIIARKIAPDRRGLAIGIFSVGIPLGTMVGFAAGGALADALGWRPVLIGAGALGVLIGLFALLALGPTPTIRHSGDARPFLEESLTLLSSRAFRWLFIGAVGLGFAAAPFYAFSAPFLIRTHGFTAGEVGLSFGLLQGALGIVGAVAGGRGFDRAVRAGTGRLLGVPAAALLVASVCTVAALFAPAGWMAIALCVPAMFAFAFLMPWCFGAAHLVAGQGRQAMASSLLMIGSGLFGPSLGPLLVGLISDTATACEIPNGLGLGLLIVPLASVITAAVLLIANQRVREALSR
ncbi:MFS transporter [Glycocaulis profundi]|nr:MFS transporter [Glycocaulis profundi]